MCTATAQMKRKHIRETCKRAHMDVPHAQELQRKWRKLDDKRRRCGERGGGGVSALVCLCVRMRMCICLCKCVCMCTCVCVHRVTEKMAQLALLVKLSALLGGFQVPKP
jgi:hypothetical protein